MISQSNQSMAKRHNQYIERAYNDVNNVYYDSGTDTMAIAGTHSLSDVLTDVNIPFGTLSRTDRYQQAKQLYNLYGKPKNVVGHSLGSSIALELQREYPDMNVITYGAPIVDINPFQRPQRSRHYGDPISMMDFGATSSFSSGWNPHSVL